MAKSPLLDFSKFKHVKSDDKATTLQHKDGHVLTINHSVLSKDNQAQLKAMADSSQTDADKEEAASPYGKVIQKYEGGGAVDEYGYPVKPGSSGGTPPPEPKSENTKPFLSGFLGKASGGEIKKMADGGHPIVTADPDKAKQMANPNKPNDTDKALTQAVQHPIDAVTKALGFSNGGVAKYADGTSQSPVSSSDVPDSLKPNLAMPQQPQMPAININLGPGTQPIQAGPGAPIPASAQLQMPDTSTPAGKQQLMIAATRAGMSVPDYLKSMGQDPNSVQSPMEAQQQMVDATRAGQTAPDQQEVAQQQSSQENAGQTPDESQGDQADMSTQEAPAAPPVPNPPQASGTAAAPTPTSAPAPAAAPPGDAFAQQVAAVQKDFDNGHITPKTYADLFADKSTPAKVATLFGMLVAGMGSGLTGQKNSVMAMMDNVINNDLDAQKNSKSNQMNFMNLAQQHLLNQANIGRLGAETKNLGLVGEQTRRELAYQMQARAAFHDQMLAAQNEKDPVKKQQMLQTLGIISQQLDSRAMQAKDMINAKSALTQGMMGAMGQNPDSEQAFQSQMRQLRLTGHEDLAKDMESKYMPGLGRASTPLSQDDRTKLRSGLEFGQALQRFTNFAQNNSGSLDPRVISQGKALASELQGAYRQASNGGVYKEGEQHFISNIIDSDPTKFFNNIRVLPKLQAVAQEHDAKMNTLTKSYGFQNQMPSSQAPQIKSLNGVQYQKVQGGWKRVQ
jgi:hypothetical protein